MMFELILTLCGGWASGAYHGRPGACLSTHQAVVQNGTRPAIFETFEDCDREYRRQIRLGQQTYVYVGFFFDRRVTVNRVISGQCSRID
jgi:hypothetical protein